MFNHGKSFKKRRIIKKIITNPTTEPSKTKTHRQNTHTQKKRKTAEIVWLSGFNWSVNIKQNTHKKATQFNEQSPINPNEG